LHRLPGKFDALKELLNKMPVIKRDGKAGLLAKGQLGDASKDIPEYDVEGITSHRLLSGKMRPCHVNL